ncbi:MAG: HAD hydrolase-like protein [Patescibacteria group bacterium]|jgi:phosphoglycolate phosphatase-like HAD superfamily hydrolase
MFKVLVLFDMDGTLIPSGINNGGHGKAVYYALEKVCGIKDASLDGIDYHGLTDTQLIYALLAKYGMDKIVAHEKLFAIFSEMAAFYESDVRQMEICALPGVKELLRALIRNGVALGVVTGAVEGIAKCKLRKAGLIPFFRIRQFGDQALQRLDLVKMALKKNEENHWAPEDRVFLFGDTPRDVKTGKIAGVKTIGVSTGLVSREELVIASPDYLFDDLTNTAHLLKIILG